MKIKKPMREIVRREDWQTLRKSFLGKWKTEPSNCCARLNTFLGPIRTTSEDKLRIVMNYLIGTAFRIGRIKHPCIIQLRARISAEIKRRKVLGEW